jgi:hypothetical protein
LQDYPTCRDVDGFGYPGASSFQEATDPNRFSCQQATSLMSTGRKVDVLFHSIPTMLSVSK